MMFSSTFRTSCMKSEICKNRIKMPLQFFVNFTFAKISALLTLKGFICIHILI